MKVWLISEVFWRNVRLKPSDVSFQPVSSVDVTRGPVLSLELVGIRVEVRKRSVGSYVRWRYLSRGGYEFGSRIDKEAKSFDPCRRRMFELN